MLIRRPYVVLYISLLLALAISGLTAAVILQMRRDALTIARDGGHNIVLLVERDLQRNLDIYAQALDSVVRAYREPSLISLPPSVRSGLLRDLLANSQGMGSLFITDGQGQIIHRFGKPPSLPTAIAETEFFRARRESAEPGLQVSRPFLPPVAEARRSIALSRRLDMADSSFAGVVVATLELDYLREQFSGLALGTGGEVCLRLLDGTPLLHWPESVRLPLEGMDEPAFGRFLLAARGDFFDTSPMDGERRWYSFRRIGNYPLVLNVALPTRDIYSKWRWRAWTIGLLAAGLDLAIVSLALLASRQLRRRKELVSELREEAHTDPLTGLNNRRAFDRRAAEEWSRSQRSGGALSLLMMDIDKFKAYNDHYGHPAGDEALKTVAHTIAALARRPGDCAARYGGEEFVVLLADGDEAHALALGERIRAAVQACKVAHLHGPLGVLTISIGVASTSSYPARDLAQLLEAADTALYRAKSEGRNRVAAYQADSVESG